MQFQTELLRLKRVLQNSILLATLYILKKRTSFCDTHAAKSYSFCLGKHTDELKTLFKSVEKASTLADEAALLNSNVVKCWLSHLFIAINAINASNANAATPRRVSAGCKKKTKTSAITVLQDFGISHS